jgi:AraC-like DNA-binding protein
MNDDKNNPDDLPIAEEDSASSPQEEAVPAKPSRELAEKLLKTNLTPSVIAARAGYGTFKRLKYVFQETTGMGFFEYRFKVNPGLIPEMERFTLDTTVNMNDVAMRTGFDTELSFVRNFLRVKKENPYEFRLKSQIERVKQEIGHSTEALAPIAQRAGLDIDRFTNAFEKITGSSPHVYRAQNQPDRIKKAKRLAADPTLSIEDIVEKLGYPNAGTLGEEFHEACGETLREYRKKVLANKDTPQIVAVKKHLEENQLSLADIATKEGFDSQYQMEQMFFAATRVTPGQYVKIKTLEKIAKIRERLRDTYDEIQGFYTEFNFISPAALGHTFVDYTGESPESYRKRFGRLFLKDAKTMLRDPAKTQKEIAAFTGYRSVKAFASGFKYFSDVAPDTYRQMLRQGLIDVAAEDKAFAEQEASRLAARLRLEEAEAREMRRLLGEEKTDAAAHPMQRAKQLLVGTDLGLEAIAAQLKLSVEEMEKQFKETQGRDIFTFCAQLPNRRIFCAEHLAHTSSLSPEAVAKRLGYSSVFSFKAEFEKKTGVPMTDYWRDAKEMRLYLTVEAMEKPGASPDEVAARFGHTPAELKKIMDDLGADERKDILFLLEIKRRETKAEARRNRKSGGSDPDTDEPEEPSP